MGRTGAPILVFRLQGGATHSRVDQCLLICVVHSRCRAETEETSCILTRSTYYNLPGPGPSPLCGDEQC